jgi:hypothetical protein
VAVALRLTVWRFVAIWSGGVLKKMLCAVPLMLLTGAAVLR